MNLKLCVALYSRVRSCHRTVR